MISVLVSLRAAASHHCRPPAGSTCEIAPLIDPQDNLREGGGRQVLPIAGELRDQLFQAGIVPDHHDGPRLVSRTVRSTERMSAGLTI
jgi:hypothetical protein